MINLLRFLAILAAVFLITAFSPAEKTLGTNARVVYLHGAWVWTALAAILAAGITGTAGILTRQVSLQRWSRALGRAGLLWWITYLPISLWAMQANWNGLFLSEPRWRMALIFALGGLVLQIGVSLIENPAWAALANPIFALLLFLGIQTTDKVLHPQAPMLQSHALAIQVSFAVLLVLLLLAAWQTVRWWLNFEK